METAASEFTVAVDIGSSRTRCLIAEIAGSDIRIVGRGDETSRGIRRGEVVDLPAARYTVAHAIASAEEQAGVEVQTLFLAAGSRHVRFFNNRACVGITRESHTINTKDARNVLARAQRVPVREDAVVIGTLVCSYAVDDVRHVREPRGMHGTRLEAEVHVITDARTTAENLASCVDSTKHEIEQYVFAPYAAGQAVVDEDERKLGVAVVDIGAGTTGIMLYRDHAPVLSAVVPVGGDHITDDIATGMNLGSADAGRLKEEHAEVGSPQLRRPILFERLARGGTLSVDPRRLHSIVDCRVREILEIVRGELMRAGVRPASIRTVLTGGTSRLPGIEALAGAILDCPVRVGRPQLGDRLGPEMATAAGMLLVGARVRELGASPVGASGPAGKLLNWFRQLF